MKRKMRPLFFLIFGISLSVIGQSTNFELPNAGNARYVYRPIREVKVENGNIEVIIYQPHYYGTEQDPYPKEGDSVTFLPLYTDSGKWCREAHFKIKTAIRKAADHDDGEDLTLSLQENPNSCLPKKGDLIQLAGAKPVTDKQVFLYRIADDCIHINSSISDEVLYLYFLPDSKVEHEWETILYMMKDLKSYADLKRSDKPVFLSDGPFKGKTISVILDSLTPKDIIEFMNYLVSYPRKYMGKTTKFSDLYLGWIKENQPKGNLKDMNLYTKYDSLLQMKLLSVDIEKGLIGGMSVSSPGEILKKYPFYNEVNYSKNSDCNDNIYWSVLSNDIKYYPAQKYFKPESNHNDFVSRSVFDLKMDATVKMRSEPDKIIKEGDLQHYLYKKQYGTLDLVFNMKFVNLFIAEVRLYSISPENIVLCK